MALEKESGVKCDADIITWRGMMTKVSEGCLPVVARGCEDVDTSSTDNG